MRIAVLSDIHGNSVAFDRVIEDINNQNIEGMIFLGDLVSKGPDPRGVFNGLKDLKPIVWLKGNTDAWFDEDLDGWIPKSEREKYLYDNYNYVINNLSTKDISFIKSLPEKQVIKINNQNILCVHGSPRNVDESLLPETTEKELKEIFVDVKEDIILSGHIHEPYIRKVFDKVIINPGAIGFCNHTGDSRASYAIIEFNDNIKVDFIKLNYDHQQAIHLAKKNELPYINMFEKYMLSSEV